MDHNFKHRELSRELRHEDEWNKKQSSKPQLKGYYFYNIPLDDRDTAAAYGIKQLKSGKWGMPIYDKSGISTVHRKRLADDLYGPGKWWSPHDKKIKEDGPGNVTISQVNKDKATVTSTDQAGMKTTSEVPTSAFARNAQGQLTLPDKTKLPGVKMTTGTQPQNTQQQTPKAGEKLQLSSIDNELDSIKKFAGL